jgi:hypothetical protein
MTPKKVTQHDIDRALLRVEKHDLDTANLLRAWIAGLARRVEFLEMGDDRPNATNQDDESAAWAGALR